MSKNHETDGEFQKRHVKRPVIVGASTLAFAFLFVAIIAYVFDWGRDQKSDAQKTGERKLAELRAAHEAELASFGWVDKEKGVVRIPVAQAIEKLLAAGPVLK